MNAPSIREQIRRNAVALISLTVAVSSLGYNTWRNETTERQRNLRHASFELVEQIGTLQSRANQLVYSRDPDRSVWIGGWGNVLTIRTLGRLLPQPVVEETETLYRVWMDHVSALDGPAGETRKQAEQAVNAQIELTRGAILEVLSGLD